MIKHEHQVLYSKILLARLRENMVATHAYNTKYSRQAVEAGHVKIPVRTGDMLLRDYNSTDGIGLKQSMGTEYVTISDFDDKAFNELLPYVDIKKIPDDLVVSLLDEMSYALLEGVEKDAFTALVENGTEIKSDAKSVYERVLDMDVQFTKAKGYRAGRVLFVSPEKLKDLILDNNFIKNGDMSQGITENGPRSIGTIAGLPVYESNIMGELGADMILTHPEASTRVEEIVRNPVIEEVAAGSHFVGEYVLSARVRTAYKVLRPELVIIDKGATAAKATK